MKRNEFDEKFVELLSKTKFSLVAEGARIAFFEQIGLSEAENNYRLPKAVLVAALRNVAKTWEPLPCEKDTLKLIKRLEGAGK